MKFLKHLFLALSVFSSVQVFAEVIPVEPLTKGLFGTQQTMTMLYERSDAELTIVAVMGHPGHFGLKIGDPFVKNQTARMMRDIGSRPKIKANVVILDSPFPLQGLGARSLGLS